MQRDNLNWAGAWTHSDVTDWFDYRLYTGQELADELGMKAFQDWLEDRLKQGSDRKSVFHIQAQNAPYEPDRLSNLR